MARVLHIAKLAADGTRYERELDKLERKTKGSSEKIKKSWGGINSSIIKVGASLIALQQSYRFLSDSYKLYLDQVRSEAKVAQAVKQTGNAAGFTAKELKKMASSLQDITGIGDEQILNDVTAQLLTFGSLSGKVFERAQKAVIDIAAVIGTDMKSGAIQLGKVLEDPVGQMSALSRSGIVFSETSEATIKSLVKQGKLQEAQLMVLDEINRLYGGQAEAINKATGGIMGAEAAWGDFKETVGQTFTPLINTVLPAITKAIKGWAVILKNISGVEDKAEVTFGQRKAFYEQIKDYNKEQLKAERDQLTAMMKTNEAARMKEGIADDERKWLSYQFDLLYAQWQIVTDINKAKKEFATKGGGAANLAKTEAKQREEILLSSEENLNEARHQLYQDYINTYMAEEQAAADEQAASFSEYIDGKIEEYNRYLAETEQAENDRNQRIQQESLSALSELGAALQNAFSRSGDTLIAKLGQALQLAVNIANAIQRASQADAGPAGGLGIISSLLGFFTLFGAQGGTFQNGKKVASFAGGGDFIVPPGFSNDSYPIMVQSGERVQVTPSHRVGQSDYNIVKAITGLSKRIEAYNLNVASAMNGMPPIVLNIDGRQIAKATQNNINQLEREGVNKNGL